MSHFNTLVGLGISLVLSTAQAAETAGGGASTYTPSGINGTPTGDARPTIHYLSPPTKPLSTTPPKPRGEELKKILDALGVMMAPKNSATGTEPYPTGYNEFAGSSYGEPVYTGSGAHPISAMNIGGSPPIAQTFQKYFNVCTTLVGLGQCNFVNLGIWGDQAHQQRQSCHNVGEAIDVGPLTCSGGQASGTINPDNPRFYDMVKCMAQQTNNELETIFHLSEGPPNMIQKSDHSGHVHIQLKNCRMVRGNGSGPQ